MNKLEKTKANYIGDEISVKKLARAEKARILVLSDSHGNYGIVRKIISRYSPDCDAIVFCGDCVTELYNLLSDAFEEEDFRNALSPVIAVVAGNCDSDYESSEPACINLPERGIKITVPEYQNLLVGTHNFYISHGHGIGVEFGTAALLNKCRIINADFALYGHTHIAKEEYDDGIRAINPGSCARPRGGQLPGFAIVTVQDNIVDTAFLCTENYNSPEPDFKIYKPIC